MDCPEPVDADKWSALVDKSRALVADPGQLESELDWGYLEIWSTMSFRSITERPTDQEIQQHKGCRLGDVR